MPDLRDDPEVRGLARALVDAGGALDMGRALLDVAGGAYHEHGDPADDPAADCPHCDEVGSVLAALRAVLDRPGRTGRPAGPVPAEGVREASGSEPAPPWDRFAAAQGQIANFVEWMADKPCTGIFDGKTCREDCGVDLEWACVSCRAKILRYGPILERRGR